MRWLLGCLGVVFIIFGGCVLAIFSQGVASDEAAFAIGALLIFLFGIWAIYKARCSEPRPPVAAKTNRELVRRSLRGNSDQVAPLTPTVIASTAKQSRAHRDSSEIASSPPAPRNDPDQFDRDLL